MMKDEAVDPASRTHAELSNEVTVEEADETQLNGELTYVVS